MKQVSSKTIDHPKHLVVDAFIAKHTRFSNWEQMLEAAVKEWTTKKLGLKR